MLSSLRPKHIMIFGVISMLCGLGVFALWKVDALSHWDILGTGIIRWCRKTLGRYGISAFYFLGGMFVFLRGYFAMRSEERSREINQRPPHY